MTDPQSERLNEDPRVKQLIEDVAAVKGDVGALKIDVAMLSTEVATNTVLTKQVKENTAGLVNILNESEQAFRLFNRIMNCLRWFVRSALGPLAIVVGGIWAVTHDGRPPEWLKSWIDLFK